MKCKMDSQKADEIVQRGGGWIPPRKRIWVLHPVPNREVAKQPTIAYPIIKHSRGYTMRRSARPVGCSIHVSHVCSCCILCRWNCLLLTMHAQAAQWLLSRCMARLGRWTKNRITLSYIYIYTTSQNAKALTQVTLQVLRILDALLLL